MQSFKLTRIDAEFERVQEEIPTASKQEVVVKIKSSGVCHTDLHMKTGKFDLGNSSLDFGKNLPLPITFGHEIAGVVVSVGSEVTHVKPNDRVVVFPFLDDDQHIGIRRNGGYSTHVLVGDAKYCLPLPDDIEFDRGCLLMCSGLTAYRALKRVKENVAHSGAVVIIGAGGVGLQAVSLCSDVLGIPPIVVDINDTSLESSKEVGGEGTITINSSNESALAQIIEAGASRGGVRAVIDFVGSQKTSGLGMQILASRRHNSFIEGNTNGKLVLVGLFGGLLAFPIPLMIVQCLTVEASYAGSLSDAKELIELARGGKLHSPPITVRPLEEVNQALDDLLNGKIRGRQVLHPREE